MQITRWAASLSMRSCFVADEQKQAKHAPASKWQCLLDPVIKSQHLLGAPKDDWVQPSQPRAVYAKTEWRATCDMQDDVGAAITGTLALTGVDQEKMHQNHHGPTRAWHEAVEEDEPLVGLCVRGVSLCQHVHGHEC